MIFREAIISDIPQIQLVRNLVKENPLPDPCYFTDAHCVESIIVSGKGSVCEIDNVILSFSIVGLKEKKIWALFINPDFEAKGISKKLHSLMLDWYFTQTK